MIDSNEVINHEYYDYLLELMNKYFRFREFNNDEVLSLYTKKPFDFYYKVPREENYKIIEKDLNYHFKKIKGSAWQAHSDKVVIIDEDNLDTSVTDIDGLLTNLVGVGLEIRTADCQSIFLYDPVKKVIGNIHSGWKGTYKQIVLRAIDKMIEHYGSKVEDILVGFNPSILRCCFEVKDDVIDLFKEICDVDKYIKKDKDKYLLDTVSINYDKLIERGIKKEHIFLSNICTGCNTIEYHSYRKENKTDGRNGSFICLK
jgi:YfiH family protein